MRNIQLYFIHPFPKENFRGTHANTLRKHLKGEKFDRRLKMKTNALSLIIFQQKTFYQNIFKTQSRNPSPRKTSDVLTPSFVENIWRREIRSYSLKSNALKPYDTRRLQMAYGGQIWFCAKGHYDDISTDTLTVWQETFSDMANFLFCLKTFLKTVLESQISNFYQKFFSRSEGQIELVPVDTMMA